MIVEAIQSRHYYVSLDPNPSTTTKTLKPVLENLPLRTLVQKCLRGSYNYNIYIICILAYSVPSWPSKEAKYDAHGTSYSPKYHQYLKALVHMLNDLQI